MKIRKNLMKKMLHIVSSLMVVVILASCGGTTLSEAEETSTSNDVEQTSTNDDTEDTTKIALLLTGKLGDKSILDSAQRGMDTIKEKYGDKVEITTVEMTDDETKFIPTMQEFADNDYDIIITGTWLIVDQLTEVAPMYPDIDFIYFDNTVDYSNGDYDNIYSITFKANEGSFLGGAAATMVTNDKNLQFANDESYIGFLGGIDAPGINDFLLGYIQGAKHINQDVKVNTAYIGSFVDTAKAKEMTLNQYSGGVDISFNVAGPAGLGMVDAAAEANAYVLGVDSDQAVMFQESHPEKAELIASSVMKNIDNSLVRAIDMYFEGNIPTGTEESLGLAEGGVGLAKNSYFETFISEENRKILDDLEQQIISGEIVVDTAYGKTQEEISEIVKSVSK